MKEYLRPIIKDFLRLIPIEPFNKSAIFDNLYRLRKSLPNFFNKK